MPLEGTRNKKHNCLIVVFYLPQILAEHAKACSAINTLPITYPHHLIILGGEEGQGDIIISSEKACHLRTLPLISLKGPHLPSHTPPNHQSQTKYIEHLPIHDPYHTTIQAHDIDTITYAFSCHKGVKVAIHIPLLCPPRI